MIERGLRLLARSDLEGHPNTGEGSALKIARDGKRYLFVSHENGPAAVSVLDVTEPSRPQLVHQSRTPSADVRMNSLSLHGDTLLVSSQVLRPGQRPAGVFIYDVADPSSPREIAFFDTSGPFSRGVHFVSSFDGEFAHLSTGAPDFEPMHPKDDQIYMTVDIRDLSHPREAGRWWLPGQRKGDGVPLERHATPAIDHGFRPHHTLCYPERPDRTYVGYIDGGIVILDTSDRSAPKLVARLDYHPPMPGFTHTVLPLFPRDLLVVTDEASTTAGDPAVALPWLATTDGGDNWRKRVWIVDVRDERGPVIISTAPDPEGFAELQRIGGRIGAHNIHENEPSPGTAHLLNTVVATQFSAGLRVYDIRNPFRPEEVAAFLPDTPAGQRGCRISDVFVEDRGIVYAFDRVNGGVYILEYTGVTPLD
ncbi:MAG: hypothetical protein KGJ98_00515 [Chloroflexota bacterium]|nr:hypothetical protein [Chloroflexota bacterium]